MTAQGGTQKIASYTDPANRENDPKTPDGPARKARPRGLPRSYVEYWKGALRVDPVTSNYFVQIFYEGQRGRFTFERNKDAAAEKARLIFSTIQRHGWDAARHRFSHSAEIRSLKRNEEAHRADLGGRIEDPTIGDLIRTAKEISEVRPGTFHRYEADLRFIVSQVFSLPHMKKISDKGKSRGKRKGHKAVASAKDIRYDYASGGLSQWRATVDSVKLSALTPERVERWRVAYLKKSGDDPVAKSHARGSFNRSIRNARTLLGKKILGALKEHLILPQPLPFDGVHKEKEPPMRYQSRFDPRKLLAQAKNELQPEDPEAYKALLLCLLLGLRRNEADTLLKEQVDFDLKQIAIEPTHHYFLKSPDSARVIPLDDNLVTIFREWFDRSQGPFVMESRFEARPMTLTRVYRCERTFKRLISWLRAYGISANKPIHELRKEAGTILLMQGVPIEAVSRFLGHANLEITLKLYADLLKGRRATMDVAALMRGDNVLLFPKEAVG